MQTKGVIYILTNPSFPNYVKIGYADDVNKRLKDLNRSECIPFAFRLYAYYEVNERLTDMKLHSLIDGLNPNLRSIDEFNGKKRKKEFFKMTKEDAYKILESIASVSGTQNKLHIVEQLTIDKNEAEEIDKTKYSIDMLLSNKTEHVVKLYNLLKESLAGKINKYFLEATPNYIALRNSAKKNICEIHLQKNRLMIITRMPVNDDSLNIGHKLPETYLWSLNYRVYINNESELTKLVGLLVNVADQIAK